jgi:hypothetical protein
MVKITTPSLDFNFENIVLTKPIVLNEGSFYSKIVNQDQETITIQSPQCKTKGIMNVNKKIYTDLVFDVNNRVFSSWINSLEERLQQEIYNNRETWFVSAEIELDDIQLAFSPILKLYKGSSYITRTYIQNGSSDVIHERIQVYNEDETPRRIQDIKEDDAVITILEFHGIKFSQRSFQLYIIVKQIMILETIQLSGCIINKHAIDSSVKEEIESSIKENIPGDEMGPKEVAPADEINQMGPNEVAPDDERNQMGPNEVAPDDRSESGSAIKKEITNDQFEVDSTMKEEITNQDLEFVDVLLEPSRRKRLLIQYLESKNIKEMSALEEIETDSD